MYFRLKGLTWGNGQAVQDYALENAQLRIPLPEPLPPGGAIELKLAYDLALPSPQPSPQVRPIPFGYTAKQTNLVDWYPFIAPYRSGEGWLAHPAGFFGEHLVYDKADFDIRLRLADRRDDLVIAASAPGVIRERLAALPSGGCPQFHLVGKPGIPGLHQAGRGYDSNELIRFPSILPRARLY